MWSTTTSLLWSTQGLASFLNSLIRSEQIHDLEGVLQAEDRKGFKKDVVLTFPTLNTSDLKMDGSEKSQ